ncbi:BRCT domain-containing protein [Paracoccus sp. MC1854]|uniref:BRCT domain-containing protein n=1 Tax=Paracoccus sp. MC1854 TaxID=2760306 RepID=UPI0015FFF9AA|nr:BRCT domain-containing protein [Paracoccus sp. MC1854]MBB1491911.1 BRCT domain-containing protein [Paracoccus sp. MC1854]
MNEKDLPLAGKTIVFTGSLSTLSRSDQRAIAAHFGAKCSNIVNSETAFLVVGEDHISARKIRIAKECNIQIVDESKLLELMAFKPFSHFFPGFAPQRKLASEAQLASIENFYNTEIDFEMTEVQANTLLSIRDYVQAVARIIRREGGRVSSDAEVVVAALLVNDSSLSDYAKLWNARRFSRGTHNSYARLARDETFKIVYDIMQRTMQEY